MNESATQQSLSKRLLAALFAVVLVVGLVPISAWADGDEEQNSTTQEQSDSQTGSESVSGGGEPSDNADQDGTEPSDSTGSEGDSEDGNLSDDADQNAVNQSDADQDGDSDGQNGNEASSTSESGENGIELASLEGNSDSENSGYTNPYWYDGDITNAEIRSILETSFPGGVDLSYRLSESDRLIFVKGDNPGTFTPQNRGYCSYGVQMGYGDYRWTPAGTLILLEKVNVGDIQDVIYDGNEHKLAPTVTGANGKQLDPNATYPDYELKYYRGDVETTDFTSPGEIKVVVKFTCNFKSENYYPDVTKTYTIQKMEGMTVDVSGCGYSGVYDGSEHAGNAAIASIPDGTADKATIEYSTDGESWSTVAPAIKNVGKTTVQVRVSHSYYKDATGSYTLEVAPATATVTAKSASKTYGQNDPDFTAEVTGLVNGESSSLIKYSVSRNGIDENADTYKGVIVPTGETSQGNYSVEYVPADFTINQAKVTVAADPASKVYGEDDPIFTAKVDGLVNGESEGLISYTVSRTNVDENADTYKGVIVPTGEASQGNYSVEYVPADFTINQAKVTVAADPASKIYGESDPEFSATVKGVVNGESEDLIKYTVARSNKDENADTYEGVIVPTGETSQGNYSVEYVPADFTIAKRAIEVNDSATLEYNGQEQVLNIDAAKVTNLADGDRLYLSNAQVKGTEPGTYADVTEYTWKVLNAELGDGSDVTANYDLKVSGELTITAAADNDSAADEAGDSSATPQTGDSDAPFAVGAAFAAALATFLASRKFRGVARR